MKANLLVILLGTLAGVSGYAQGGAPPPIQWQRHFGGVDNDFLSSVRQTPEAGYIIGGTSYSPRSGNRTATNIASGDYWIVRLDALGHPLWEQCFGGTSFEDLRDIQGTSTGGCVLGGLSESGVSGNKTTPRVGTNFTGNWWFILLDPNGNKVREQTIGSEGYDNGIVALVQLPDGGFCLAGRSGGPPSGHKTATNWGNEDYWVVSLDADGVVLWDRSFGGIDSDMLWDMIQTTDGGFILGGGSASPPGGNKTSQLFGNNERYFRRADFWIVRLDGEGHKLWDRSFGGTEDDTLYTLRQMPDGGFALGGRSLSPPGGNKTSPNFGNADFWLVLLDAEGNKIAEQTFGGIGDDYLYSLDVTADGGLILGGYSGSPPSGNKTSVSFGSLDYWVVRLDADRNKLWEASYGGSHSDVLQSLQQTTDGGFILGGYSWSSDDGNKTVPNVFFADYWLIKLGPEQPQLRLTRSAPAPVGLRLELEGIKNLRYAIEYSTRLDTWTPLQTNRLASSRMEVPDPGMTNSPQRFYRARQVP